MASAGHRVTCDEQQLHLDPSRALLREGHFHPHSIKYSCMCYAPGFRVFFSSFPPTSNFVIGSLYPAYLLGRKERGRKELPPTTN